MRIGIGTNSHMDALRAAGAGNLLTPKDVFGMKDDLPMRNFVFRPGDVIVLAHPTCLGLPSLKMIGDHGVTFEVIGHEPMTCKNDTDRRYLRSLKPKGINAEKVEKRGAKPVYPVMSVDVVRAMAVLWYSEAKRSVVVDQVGVLVGRKVPMSWVRDQMDKHYGHARRTAEPGWETIEIITKKEAE